MSGEFFYNTYAKFSKRGNKLRLKVTPFGIIVISVCLISGLAGLNIFSSGLYRIFTLTLSLIIISRFSRLKDFSGISVSVFFDRQYRVDEPSKYSVTLINESAKDLFDLELIPEIEKLIPSKDDFLTKKEPGEDKRNIWDRNIYYFRWAWHIFRLHKAEFRSIKRVEVKKGSYISLEAEIIPLKRGIISFKGFNVTKKDIFGLFTSSVFIPAEESIVLLPKLAEVDIRLRKEVSSSSDRKNRFLSAYLMKHKTGDFIGLREYAPGDPMRNIHWKTWAKTGKPAVVEKGFEKVKECSVILVNFTADENGKFGMLFENCVSYLYSTVKYLEENDYEVTFYMMSENGEIFQLRAEKEKGNYAKLYNIFAGLEYYNGIADRYISKLKRLHSIYSSSLIFCTEIDPAIERFAHERNILILTCAEDTHENANVIRIPEINRRISEVNLA